MIRTLSRASIGGRSQAFLYANRANLERIQRMADRLSRHRVADAPRATTADQGLPVILSAAKDLLLSHEHFVPNGFAPDSRHSRPDSSPGPPGPVIPSTSNSVPFRFIRSIRSRPRYGQSERLFLTMRQRSNDSYGLNGGNGLNETTR